MNNQNLNNIYNFNNGGGADSSKYYDIYGNNNNNYSNVDDGSNSSPSLGTSPPLYSGWLVSNMVSSPLIVTNLVLGLHTLTVFLVDSHCNNNTTVGDNGSTTGERASDKIKTRASVSGTKNNAIGSICS